MTPGEIAERLIQAAEIALLAGGPVGPQEPRSLSLGYAHTWKDVNGWGGARLQEEIDHLWQQMMRRPTSRQISEADEAMGWLALVDDERERAALAAWVWAMANPRIHFKDWCFKQEGIHPETGRRRKNRALECIFAKISRRPLENKENADFGVLPDTHEIDDIEPTFESLERRKGSVVSWAADPSFRPIANGAPSDFSWARKRWERQRKKLERRKAKEEKRRKAAEMADAPTA